MLMFTIAVREGDARASADEPAQLYPSSTPEEGTPPKTLQAPPRKPKSKAAKKAQEIKRAAKEKADQASNNASFQGIQDQMRLLNEKIDRLEAERSQAATPVSILSDESVKDQPGFVSVPGAT